MYLDRIREADPTVKVDAIYGAGGGAHSAVFGKIKADVLGVPYIPLTCGDTGSFGSAVLAGYGVGYYTDLSAAARLNVRESEPILPDTAVHEAYAASAAAYVRALDAAGTMYEEVAL
jgi:sugar (pentulose or hexulose) kinase